MCSDVLQPWPCASLGPADHSLLLHTYVIHVELQCGVLKAFRVAWSAWP